MLRCIVIVGLIIIFRNLRRIVLGLLTFCVVAILSVIITTHIWLPTLLNQALSPLNLSVTVQEHSLSFLNGSLSLEKMTIFEDAEVRAYADQLFVDVDLTDLLFRNKIIFEKLLLDLHSVSGLDQNSRFWSTLLAPSPKSENDQPRSVSYLPPVSFSDLSIEISEASFVIDDISYSLEELKLSAEQDKQDSLPLTASLQSLSLEVPSEEIPTIQIRDFNLHAALEEKQIAIDSVAFKLWHSDFSAKGTIGTDSLQLRSAQQIDVKDIPLDFQRQGILDAETSLSGALKAPTICSSIRSQEQFALALEQEVIIDSITADLCASILENFVAVESELIEISGQGFSLSVLEPLQITPQSLSGKLLLSVPSFAAQGISAKEANLRLELGGSLDTPNGRVEFSLGNVQFSETQSLDTLSLTGVADNKKLSLRGGGTLSGVITGNLSAEIQMEKVANHPYKLASATLFLDSGVTNIEDTPVTLSGSIRAQGPLNPKELSGIGQIDLVAETPLFGIQELNIAAQMKNGTVELQARDKKSQIQFSSTLPLEEPNHVRGSLIVQNYQLDEVNGSQLCAKVTASGEYTLPFDQILSGSASLRLSELSFGCLSEPVTLRQGVTLRLDNSALQIPPLTLQQAENEITVAGTFGSREFESSVDGQLSLAPLDELSGAISNLRGKARIGLLLSGEYQDPQVVGEISLSEGGVIVPEPPIDLRNIDGIIKITESQSLQGQLTTTLNNGSATLNLKSKIGSWSEIQGDISFRGIHFSPMQQGYVILGGDLQIENLLSPDKITGTVRLEEAFYQTKVGLQTLIAGMRDLLRSFLEEAELPSEEQQLSEDTLVLDVSVQRSGDVRFTSNFAAAELTPDLRITGAASNPRVSGAVRLDSGWFALGSNRFLITDGAVFFPGHSREPQVEIRGQTAVVTRSFERIQITVLISGPVSDPKVEFSSSAGLNQREILRLLTGGEGGQDLVSTLAETLDYEVLAEGSLLGDLASLTTLDSLTVRPELSAESGSVAPRIIAEKKITSRLGLESSTVVGDADAPATVTGTYRLTDRWGAEGTLTTPTATQQQSIYGGLRYEIIRSRDRFELFISGAEEVGERVIRERLAFNPLSKVSLSELPQIEERVKRLYAERGFKEASIEARCSFSEGTRCLSLELRVDEGQPTIIAQPVFDEQYSPQLQTELLSAASPTIGKRASEENVEKARKRILKRLREMGYPSALVNAELGEETEHRSRPLKITLEIGPLLEIELHGNERFSKERLLEAANFYSQQVPFGDQVTRTLAKRIEAFYRKQGYPGVSAQVICLRESTPPRCTIEIEEGRQVSIAEVRLDFDQSGLPKRVLTSARQKGVFTQEVAERKVSTLESELQKLGFTRSRLRYESRVKEPGQVIVTIHGELGPQKISNLLEVQALHGKSLPIILPNKPATLSLPSIRSYRRTVRDKLHEAGYQRAQVQLNFRKERSELLINLSEPIRIGKLRVEGNRQVSTEEIIQASQLKSGEILTEERMRVAREMLNRMGRFREVTIRQDDSPATSPTVVLEVSERGPRELTIGSGYDTIYGIRATVDGIERSLFPGSGSLRAFADLYYDFNESEISRGGLNLSYIDSLFLNRPLQFSETLSYLRSTRTVQEFELSRLSLATLLQESVGENWQLGAGHTFLFDDLFDVSPDAILSDLDTGNVFLSYLSTSAGYDSTDSPLNPKSGLRANIDTKFATHALGSEADFFGIQPKLRWLYRLPNSSFSLQIDAASGIAREFGGTTQIPITQRYYLGGLESVRGFAENSLGPRGAAGSVLGGNTFYSGSTQLNYFITEQFDFHSFFDFGRLWLIGGPDDSQRESVGLGVRYASPVGPISLDVGFPIDKRSGEDSFRVHFSLGASF